MYWSAVSGNHWEFLSTAQIILIIHMVFYMIINSYIRYFRFDCPAVGIGEPSIFPIRQAGQAAGSDSKHNWNPCPVILQLFTDCSELYSLYYPWHGIFDHRGASRWLSSYFQYIMDDEESLSPLMYLSWSGAEHGINKLLYHKKNYLPVRTGIIAAVVLSIGVWSRKRSAPGTAEPHIDAG